MSENEGSSSRCVCLESRKIEDNNVRNFQKINFILIRKIKFSKILISVVKNQETNQERRKFFASMRLESKITVRNLRNSKILINLISGNEDRQFFTSKYALKRRKITKWILKLCENFCERNLYNRIHHYERCHRNSSYKLSTLGTVSNFQKINFNSILAISQKIVLDFTWKIIAKRCRRNS